MKYIISQKTKFLENSRFPFNLLVKNTITSQDFSRPPIFQVFFDCQEENNDSYTSLLKQQEGLFDLSLIAFNSKNKLTLQMQYCTQSFSDETINNFSNRLLNILDCLLSNPDAKISDISMLSESDIEKVTQEWNLSGISIPFFNNVHSIFEAQVDKTPDSIAAIIDNVTYTYKELDIKANQIANFLRSHSIINDTLVGIYIDRSIEMLSGLLGILKAGAAYVPLDPSFPSERIGYIIKDSAVSIILTKKNLLPSLTFSGTCVCLDQNEELTKASKSRPLHFNKPDDLAYILYTSGSTGQPKGVEISHESMINFLLSMAINPGLKADDTFCAVTTISFDIAVLELFGPLCVGAKTVILNSETSKDVHRLANALTSFNATIVQATPATWEMLTASGWKGMQNLRILCGGEALRPDLAKRLLECASEVWNMYGPTETTVWSSCCKLSKTEKIISAGKPIANTSIYILDKSMRPLPSGIQGDLYIGGKGVARGYHNRADLTEKKFFPDPFSKIPNSRMYSTGDRARFLNDGNIVIMGRSDFQIKIRGFRIEPGEIEITLRAHQSVKDAVVIARDSRSGQKLLVAYIVKSSDSFSIPDIKQHCTKHLPEYMVPSLFITIDNMPLTPNGKVNTLALPNVSDDPYENLTIVPPRNQTEEKIAVIWKRILSIETVGIHDSFFDIGGTSLSASLLAAELRNKFSQEISVVQIFQYPTIYGLADYFNNTTKENSLLDNINKMVNGQKFCKIAIIGMSGRFPGADSIDKFWLNLLEGKETVTQFSREELDEVEDELRNDPAYIPARGILTDIDKFDADFFGIRHSEAQIMDPQQRLLMQTAWSALEDAGYAADRYDGSIGVFAGMGNNTYYAKNLSTHPELLKRIGAITVELGTEKDHIAPRISYAMNLKGPSLSIHTACSTTLVVIDSAFHALNSHQCDIALAGGIDISIPQKSGQLYQEGGIFTKDGHCRPFDANSTGTMFGEAVAMVALKRLDDAIADHDNIYAVILGTAVNHDGSQKANYLAPSIDGQAEVIALAQARANVHPEKVGYIEAHGTATPIGDPIEIEGLTKAFRLKTSKNQFCAVGSVKGNLGHSTTAAGIVGLIKAALVVKNGQIPPTINFNIPNPRIDFQNSPFFVNTNLSSWPLKGVPRIAGVSSFGFCGTNAHVVLQEPPVNAQSSSSRPRQLLMLSAKSKQALDNVVSAFHSFVKQEEHPLADIAFTLQNGRNFFKHRRFFVSSDSKDAAAMLSQPDPNRYGERIYENSVPQIVFLFPGQGSQYVNMGKSLYRDELLFKETIDTCASILKSHIGRDIRELLYPSDGDTETAALSLKETRFTQPAIFMIEYALAQLWMSWGIRPDAMIGHSIGEFVCACLAGVFSLEDALALIAKRGSLMQDLPRGSMLSVRLDSEKLQKILPDDLSIAAINGPELCVVSGPVESVSNFSAQIEKDGVITRQLHSSHAFHSSMMEPVVKPFQDFIKQIKLSSPQIPFVSTVKGNWIKSSDATDPLYWANHLRAPVNFYGAIAEVLKESPRVLLEVGPRATSATLARQQISDPKKHAAIPSLGDTYETEAEWTALLKAIGSLWLWGINIDCNRFYQNENRQRRSLPTYSFEKVRHWIEPANKKSKPGNILSPYLHKELSVSQTENNTNNNEARPFILDKVRKIIEDISGISLSESMFNKTFLDLGFDSLVLTQIARVISKEIKSPITLRQLMENFSSIDILTDHLVSSMPAEMIRSLMPEKKVQSNIEEPDAYVPQTPSSRNIGSSTISANTLEQTIVRQLDIIERLVTLLETRDKKGNPDLTISKSPEIAASQVKHASSNTDTSKSNSTILHKDNPPVPGARLGRDENGNPAWYVPDPTQSGKFTKLEG